MDEILIEEKRYISSKRAAKITGYAKDYIGQLCREGRVPARLVGRSWYVLETAIQDHRFGNQDIGSKEPLESPKYEASPVEILPLVSRADEEDEEVVTTSIEDGGGSEDNSISDSWREWFDRVSNTEVQSATVQTTDPVTISTAEEPELEPELEPEPEPETEPVEVPIHTIYRQPPQELLPHNIVEIEEEKTEEQEQPQIQQETQKGSRVMIRAIQACGIALAMVTATLAVAGSGYLDKYIISVGQVRIIAGVTLYNK